MKPVFKHGDEFIDATGTVIKNADNIVDATGTVIRKADDVADVASDIAKHGDDFVQSLPSSKKLRSNLELAGVEVPDYPNAVLLLGLKMHEKSLPNLASILMMRQMVFSCPPKGMLLILHITPVCIRQDTMKRLMTCLAQQPIVKKQ